MRNLQARRRHVRGEIGESSGRKPPPQPVSFHTWSDDEFNSANQQSFFDMPFGEPESRVVKPRRSLRIAFAIKSILLLLLAVGGIVLFGDLFAIRWLKGLVALGLMALFLVSLLSLTMWLCVLLWRYTRKLRLLVIPLLAFSLTVSAFAGANAYAVTYDPVIDAAFARRLPPREHLTFYVASGTAVGTPVYTTAERLVTSEEISRSSLKLAIIAIEDERFLTRYIGPVDVIALARAMMMNLLGKRQGGSTLQLQIAKALSGKLRSSYSDKPGHSFIALRLDQRYPHPDDLLAIYSNLCEIYGDQSGMAQAAFRMFGKTSLTQLSIAESALLAGMLKSPAKYNPRSHPQEAKQRRDIVLGKMRELDMISEAEYRRAISEGINLKPQRNGYEMIARAALAVNPVAGGN